MPHRSPLARFLLGLGLVCGGVLALAGCVALGGSGLVAVAVAGTVAAALAAGVAREAPDGDRSGIREAAWRAGAWTAGILLLVAGTAVLCGGVVAALVTGVVAVGALCWWLLRRAGRTTRGAASTRGLPSADGRTTHPWTPQVVRPLPQEGRAPVASMSTSALGREWLTSTAALAGRLDPLTRAAVVRRREEALDELERRDPAGFARWLSTGPVVGSDPADYVRGNVRGDQAAGSDAA